MDLGVLLSVPLESLVVRAVLATTGAVVLVRLLLRAGVRSPQARVATALAPGAALVVILGSGGLRPELPTLMVPSASAEAVLIPVGDGYLNFVPFAVPILLGIWGAIAGVRVIRRTVSFVSTRRRAGRWAREADAPPQLRAIADRVARRLQVPSPRLAVRPRCAGGAYVVGRRRPVVIIGADLLALLDAQELEGVLAHELAHVKRRDTLVAGLLGLLRDLTFFVPGGGWAVRQLHRERELAADQLAVRATRRPGALAGGLLKVLEAAPSRHAHACAALVPAGDLIERVRILVEDVPAPSRTRRTVEHGLVIGVVATAAIGAIVAPGYLASGTEQQRDALAVVWSLSQPVAAEVPAGEARAFSVYRRADLGSDDPGVTRPVLLDEQLQENRRAAIHACAAGQCPVPDRIRSLQLQPSVRAVDSVTAERWRATPVVSGTPGADGFQMFWLTRAE
ncbi:MAG: M56 family metallopeptidase [Nitriliruptoraceae bacterium]|nr:M56 family metallopeptidase [Nitriliruptoraceae bacterium]